jgi:hypothetical protein
MKKMFMCAVLAMAGMAGNGALAASLTSGQGLTPGQQLDSDDGRFMLVLQGGDGNLVVYRKADMVPLWATYKTGGTLAVVQADRNFVVYKEGGSGGLTAIWDSKTAGANVNDPGVKLTMGNDGYLRLTDGNNRQLWTTAPPVGPCAGGTQMQVYLVCNNPGTPFQFQTSIVSCPPPLVFYPNQLGFCPFVP